MKRDEQLEFWDPTFGFDLEDQQDQQDHRPEVIAILLVRALMCIQRLNKKSSTVKQDGSIATNHARHHYQRPPTTYCNHRSRHHRLCYSTLPAS
ncbi:uncharacterized protein RCC_01887 [Ramularia collo-cygni]|uniref:Uncharacterized protein n=1 Tax=Ramularia collo-cygni TaxID=112498 RepID=A0A2D3UVD0_9PEZI|nr:uncharacterized protein RCC_01887 [Ramularia collo-cygni]CZT16047.1 uncharacterized protein RCC_01887 [Ramularia collo-cygni]